jgi:phosphate starvation-inducible protein PhoH and related proteins
MARTTKVRKQPAKGKRGTASTQHEDFAQYDTSIPAPPTKRARGPLEAKTPKQDTYLKAIRNRIITFGVGPAGTGKTFLAGAAAAEALEAGQVEKIIITRPAVEAGEKLGYLPGEIEDKIGPYIAAFRGALEERLGKGMVDYLVGNGRIEAVPLAYMRGRTFRNAFVIMDEAQNADARQIKLFLTRLGEGSTMVINGDADQVDIPRSGLLPWMDALASNPRVGVVKFTNRDIVRHDLIQEIIEAAPQGS